MICTKRKLIEMILGESFRNCKEVRIFASKLVNMPEEDFINLVDDELHWKLEPIRKLQYLVASKEGGISKDDIGVYYLYNPKEIPKGESQIYKLDLREDGFMNNDFGNGFFDEASSLSLRLINSSSFN